MLNAVKHLYRVVAPQESISQRIQNIAAAMPHRVRHYYWQPMVLSIRYLIWVVCSLLVINSQAQTYAITTLDGTSTTIKIQDNTVAASTRTPLVISCSTDKLIVSNYWAAGEVKVVNKKFLQISYHERAGSGLGIGNTLLLCVSHGKLRQAMHISSYFYELGYDKIITRYTRLLLDKENTAHTTIYDTLELKQNSRHDRITSRKSSAINSVIYFNPTQRIFCNYQKKINTTLCNCRYNFESNQAVKKYFAGTVPAFQLDNLEYIFVGNRWYCKSMGDKEYSLVD